MSETAAPEEGGDSVCWAHLVCANCGAITSEGHRAGRPVAEPAADILIPDDQP
jgi:hypothetical protein